MFMGLIALANLTGVRIAEDPATQIANAPPGYEQRTLVAQLADAVFGDFRAGAVFVIGVTALILVLAANTAFNGFPVLGSILSKDGYLPRQLHTRGDRLAFSNGILFLAGFAILLVIGFQAQVTRLIPLYTVGVFVSFTLSQTGMVRHWRRRLATETDPVARSRMRRAQTINRFGAVMTGLVLVTVLITKFTLGAWIAIVAMVAIFGLMTAIRRHYDRVAIELVSGDEDSVLPARNHGVVLVSKLHLPTLRALAYARATRPDVLEAITVNVDDEETRRLRAEWELRDIPVRLKVIESPYREITRPVLEYVKRIRTDNPRDVVTVFIPEYVVGRWWEQLLHNQSALRLKGRLLFQPGVMVTSVPWQLASSARAAKPRPQYPAGSARRGYPAAGAARRGEPARPAAATESPAPATPGQGDGQSR
jgi:Amino acid permease